MQKSHISLRDYERNLLHEIRHNKAIEAASKDAAPKKRKMGFTLAGERKSKAPKNDEQQKKMWKELENFGVAQFKGHYVGLKRIYKPEVEFNRAVRRELKYVSTVQYSSFLPILCRYRA